MRTIDRTTVQKAFRAGNDAGEGFTPEDEDERDVNALDEFGSLVLRSENDTECAVYDDGERVVAVGDVHGCWCVDVTSAVRS